MSAIGIKFDEELKQASDEEHRKLASEIRQVKARLSSLNPMSADNVRQSLGQLKNGSSDLSPHLVSLIDSILEDATKIEKAGKQASEMREILNQNILAAEQAAERREAELKKEHENRVVETARLQKRYDEIEPGFKALLENDSKLHDKILKGESLSDAEKAKFTGIPRNEAEKKEFAQDDNLKREAWDLHYKLKDNHQKISDYSKNKVEDYQRDLNSGKYKTHEEISAAKKAQESHQATHEKSEAALKRTELIDKAREKDVEKLTKLVDMLGAESCKHDIMEHFKHHGEYYQKNPEHKGAKEFDKILKSAGLGKSELNKESQSKQHAPQSNTKQGIPESKVTTSKYSLEVRSAVQRMTQVHGDIRETKSVTQVEKAQEVSKVTAPHPLDKNKELAAKAALIAKNKIQLPVVKHHLMFL